MAHAGAYMFPQAHAAAYAMTVVRMAGLKHDHPAEFAAARLSVTDAGDRDGREKRIRVIRELRHDGTMITPPDVNRSRADTTGHDGRVILGLGEVRGVGGQAEAILLERDMNGPFNGLHDAVTRCPRVSRGAWQGLVEAGAFDQFGTRLGHTMVLGTAVPPPALEWMVEERWARQKQCAGRSSNLPRSDFC